MNYMLKKRLLALLYPTRCPVCRKVIFPHEDFCGECCGKLTEYSGNFRISGAELFIAPFEYDDNISPAILLLKRGVKGNAAYALGSAVAEKLENLGISRKIDVIVPVPLHEKDERERGFNQAELIAREVGRILNITVSTGIVEKIRKTNPQKTLTKRQRKINLKDAFEVVDSAKIRDKCILLLDDVCTTGSTLSEITKLLKSKGAAAVYCAVCCKTPDFKKEDVENG